jgi:hypothetical protein
MSGYKVTIEAVATSAHDAVKLASLACDGLRGAKYSTVSCQDGNAVAELTPAEIGKTEAAE